MSYDPSRPDDEQARELLKRRNVPSALEKKTNNKARKRDRVMETITKGGDAGEINAALADERIAIARKKNSKLPPLVSLAEYMQRPRVQWLVRDLLPAGSIMVVFGPPKSGKTQTVLDLTMHGAHGMHWHGYPITQPLRVAYLAGEGHSGLRTRLYAWHRHHGTELRGDFRLVPEALPLADRLGDVLALLRAYQPDMVVIDTLNAFFGSSDENSTQDMTAFIGAVRRLRDDLSCAVIVIHHTGHAEQGRERGSSVLRGAADVIVQIARDESGSGQIGVQVVAARDMEPWDAPLSLRLQSAPTDWADDEGEPIDSVIVVAGNGPVTLPGRAGRALSDSQQATLEAVRQLAAERSNGGAVLLSRPEVVERAKKLGASRAAAYRAIDTLARRMGWRLVEPGGLQVGESHFVPVPIGSETGETSEIGGFPSQVVPDHLPETK